MHTDHCNDSKPLVDVSNMVGNTYCVVLNIMEGIGFDVKEIKTDPINNGVILKVSLNGVQFEVVGNVLQENSITFNSNCIWECELEDIKRMKSDNRPVKLECFVNKDYNENGLIKRVGSLLLPLRGVKILHSFENFEIKPSWYKFSSSCSKGYQIPPQIHLVLSIVKKAVAEHIQIEPNCLDKFIIDVSNDKAILSSNTPYTQSMLQSQHGIFVKLLDDIGQIQVGNDPLADCDIFRVTVTFIQIKNLLNLLNNIQKCNEIKNMSFVFQYDFLGSISNTEILINTNDCYAINQKISLNLRSSLKTLRLYFQRVFYIPINLFYMNDIAIAKYHFNISSLLPEEVQYFNDKSVNFWTKCGSFRFDVLNNLSSSTPRQLPLVDFILSLEFVAKRKQYNMLPTTRQLETTATEEKGSLKCLTSEAIDDSGSNFMSNKSVCTVGVNTDDHFKKESKKIYLHYIQEFENWKGKQIRYLSKEMAHTKQELRDRWQDYINLLIARLETKVVKCDQMFNQLEKTQTQLNAIADISLKNATIADNITREIESSYKKKIAQLEMKLECLRIEAEEKEIERVLLKKRNDQLEKQLVIHKTYHLSLDQLKDVLNDMRNQANRFAAIENFYKEQCFDNMHKWKFEILKLLDERNSTRNVHVNFNLEEIFEEMLNLNYNNFDSI